MSIYKTIALVSLGYILKDRSVNGGKYYSSPNSLKAHLTQILNDKLDLIFYGNCEWRPAMSKANYMNGNHKYCPVPKFKVDDIEFDSESAAEDVLFQMMETIKDYGVVRVDDYYEHCGMTNSEIDARYYGWKNLQDARVYRTHDHFYAINLPKPDYLK